MIKRRRGFMSRDLPNHHKLTTYAAQPRRDVPRNPVTSPQNRQHGVSKIRGQNDGRRPRSRNPSRLVGAVIFATTVMLPQFLQTLIDNTAETTGVVLSIAALVLIAEMPIACRKRDKRRQSGRPGQ